MDNAKTPRDVTEYSELFPALKPLPVFRVGIWGRDTDGTICYIVEDVASSNCWSAVGYQLLHLRATNPRISIRPDGISVVRISGGNISRNDEAVLQ